MNLRWASGEVSQQFQKEQKMGDIITNLSRTNINSQYHKLCVCQNQNKNKHLLYICLLIIPIFTNLSKYNSWNDKHPGKSKVEVCLTLSTEVATTSTQYLSILHVCTSIIVPLNLNQKYILIRSVVQSYYCLTTFLYHYTSLP